MATNGKIDSNVTGLRYAEEKLGCIKELDTVTPPTWWPLEPNEYSDFGGEISTIARNPINDSRQRSKGVVTDLDASGGFSMDITQTNMVDLMQGFLFADAIKQPSQVVTAATATTFTVASTTGIQDGALILGSDFANVGNNKVFVVAGTTPTTITVVGAAAEATPPAAARVTVVGQQFSSGELQANDAGTQGWPALEYSGALDLTADVVVAPGDWIYVGGDATAEAYDTAANNGFKRVRAVEAAAIHIDKSVEDMVDEVAAAKTVNVYFGDTIKNLKGTGIKRRSYTLERSLGAPDATQPAQIQAEYVRGAVPSEMSIQIDTADKAMAELTFLAADFTTTDGPTALEAGPRPTLAESDAFNTSSNVKRSMLSQYVDGDESPTPLFAFAQEIELTVDNKLSANKAIGVLGAFDISAGTFEVSGSLTAYFADVAAIKAVRDNADVTYDIIMVKNNSGIAIDFPLLSLGDGRLEIEQDEPIMVPLDMQMARGGKIDPNMDHTMSMTFFNNLPNSAA